MTMSNQLSSLTGFFSMSSISCFMNKSINNDTGKETCYFHSKLNVQLKAKPHKHGGTCRLLLLLCLDNLHADND